MAWTVVRASALSIALALAASAVCAQSPQSATLARQNYHAEEQYDRQTAELRNSRIASLLELLAEQSRSSENLAFAVRAQSQAATLLWPHNPDRARAIYRRAFASLIDSPNGADQATRSKTSEPASASEKRQMRGELLNQIAARDPVFAEELARDLAEALPKAGEAASFFQVSFSQPASSSREEAERCEMLVSAAMQIVERDPQQAMAFAQMSLALGVSSNFARLLTLMRAVDAERADLLFSNAVARLENSSRADLAAVHSLGAYALAVTNSSSKEALHRALVVRFLNVAFAQFSERSAATSTVDSREESASVYFVRRQLTELFTRYLPDRLAQLQRFASDPEATTGRDDAIDPVQLAKREPADIECDAIEALDIATRDALYASAALGWLAQSDVSRAQAAALKISSEGLRDRALIQIARRYLSDQRTEEAIALTRRIVDSSSRVDLLTMSSAAFLASKNTTRAAELLTEAETSASKSSSADERTRSLLKIAAGLAAFDTPHAFDVLQSAVKSINENTDKGDDRSAGRSPGRRIAFTGDELHATSLERTLADLARADFDRALALAQQLAGDEASVIAQLAVCRGGLIEFRPADASAADEATSAAVNH